MLKVLEPWWIVQIGYVTEDDIRVSSEDLLSEMLLRVGYRRISLLKEILSPAEILTEHKYLRLILKMHSP